MSKGPPPPYSAGRQLHIHLLTYRESDRDVFRKTLETHALPSSFSMTYHTGDLRRLDASLRFDAVVSPANSFGRMDGGFDDILSKVFSPSDDYLALTHTVQEKLWREWRGFAPPGTCTLVPFQFDSSRHGGDKQKENPWGCKVLAVCPTMRFPQDVRWDREVVYECMWTLLCEIDKWNEACAEDQRIKSILMTPLATATGRVSAQRWASQVLLAMKHFQESCESKEKWSKMEVQDIIYITSEVHATHSL